VLSGTGGDEFHAGYVGRYEALGLVDGTRPDERQRLRTIARRLLGRSASSAPAGSPGDAYAAMLNFLVPDGGADAVFTTDVLAATRSFDARSIIEGVLDACPSGEWHDRVTYVDAKTYLAGLLTLEDKLSMAHSLETRVPLLDNELVDFVLDVPFDALCRDGTGKVLFRESVRPWVPDRIYRKPKMGFGPPDASWYRGPLSGWLREMLLQPAARSLSFVRREFVESVLDDHLAGRREATYQLWSLLSFEAWCEEFGFG
jgi:asparagine synthase (glutamine-hydrolysing)